MKSLKRILFLCFLAVLTACSEDALVPQSDGATNTNGDSVDLISMVVPEIEMGDATTRFLVDNGSEMLFMWRVNDAIGVVPTSGYTLKFPINAENAGERTALFDGGDWALKPDGQYAAFYPIKGKHQDAKINRISFSYTGQTQSNYYEYDFLATGSVQPQNGQVVFNMQRLSAIVKVQINMPEGSYGRYGTLIASEPVFGTLGTLDLSGEQPIVNYNYSKTISTEFDEDQTSSNPWTYEVYMMIPPVNLNSEMLKFRITSDEGYAYEASFQGRNFEAGKAYTLVANASNAVIKNKKLIRAASKDNNISFELNADSTLNVNNETNRNLIKKVTYINIPENSGSTVLDEIGYFTNLSRLYCKKNNLTYLDVSNLKDLSEFRCEYNQLTSLDLSNNTDLYSLYCYNNQLTSMDLSNNSKLVYLSCESNQLSSLDMSRCTNLETLYCNKNQLTSLDLSNNTALTTLNCSNNPLTSLDLSNNKELEDLVLSSTQLTSLDLSNNKELVGLECNYNLKLTSLDLSNLTKLYRVKCERNRALTSLDVTNCTKLGLLSCNDNQLTTLDITTNTSLTEFYCNNNKLTSLILYKSPGRYFECSNNLLTTLDLCEARPGTIYCNNNRLTSLILPYNSYLYGLNCCNNRLTSLDLSNCPNVEWYNLYCGLQKNSSGNYVYNVVTPNEKMVKYYETNQTIPNCGEGERNYYVEFNGIRFPSDGN